MLPKLNLLVAYPYFTKSVGELIKENEKRVRLVVDSGAFTAWKLNRPITIDDYCNFLEGLPVKPWRYFSLDVVGDPQGTLKNYQTMLDRGFNPIPIFTRGEDPSVLDEYYKTSDVVGIGGLVGTKGNKGFVRGIMDRVGGRKVHWLGFTNIDFVKAYRPYMCDSSSWESAARFASVSLYQGKGKFVKIEKQNFVSKPPKDLQNLILSYGFEPREFALTEKWSGGQSSARRIGANSYVRASIDIERNINTKMFLAAATDLAVCILLDAFDKEEER